MDHRLGHVISTSISISISMSISISDLKCQYFRQRASPSHSFPFPDDQKTRPKAGRAGAVFCITSTRSYTLASKYASEHFSICVSVLCFLQKHVSHINIVLFTGVFQWHLWLLQGLLPIYVCIFSSGVYIAGLPVRVERLTGSFVYCSLFSDQGLA